MKTVPVIVTRPGSDALRWVRALQARGLKAEALPLIEITALPDGAPLQQAWRELSDYAALMFVSANAVAGFFISNTVETLINSAQSAPDSGSLGGLRCLAPGPGTAVALRRVGIPEGWIDAPPADAGQFDSEALWELVGQRPWQRRRVLIVRGESAAGGSPGRDWLARQWEAAGARVDFVVVYQRRAPVFTLLELQRIQAGAHDGSVWLLSSSEAVAHLPSGDWSQARAIATHPRIAQAARALGWGVVVPSRPALEDIVASIESIAP